VEREGAAVPLDDPILDQCRGVENGRFGTTPPRLAGLARGSRLLVTLLCRRLAIDHRQPPSVTFSASRRRANCEKTTATISAPP